MTVHAMSVCHQIHTTFILPETNEMSNSIAILNIEVMIYNNTISEGRNGKT
jgi:hypothetical protein